MSVAAITFGIVFLAELADTSGLATLVLSTKFRARWVLIGVFAGMLVHVVVAVIAGGLVALLPERPLAAIVAVIFFVGAFLLWREANEDDDDDDDPKIRKLPKTPWGVITTAFLITALSEFADPSELLIATLAARYSAPIVVGVAALLALWTVSALAVYGGTRLLKWVPVRWVTLIAAAVMVALGVLSVIQAIRG